MSQRHSTVGRRRVLTDQQVAAILRWYEARQAVLMHERNLQSVSELARLIGVAPATVYSVIKRGGVYKLPEPKQQP